MKTDNVSRGRMSLSSFLYITVMALSLASCTTVTCPQGTTSMSSDALFFGSATPTGTVTEEQWSAFIDRVVTPSFPAGFTVVASTGQWQGSDGKVVRESGHLLFVVHPPDASAEKKLLGVIKEYKATFGQESVMRVNGQSCVSF